MSLPFFRAMCALELSVPRSELRPLALDSLWAQASLPQAPSGKGRGPQEGQRQGCLTHVVMKGPTPDFVSAVAI